MKVSELTKEIVANYIRADIDDMTSTILDITLKAAINYSCTYTGLEESELDEYDDMTLAVLCLCAEFYDNRNYTDVEAVNINPTVQGILDKYSQNLL